MQLPRFGLTLFGRFELTTSDGAIPLPGRKLAGLLAYLACTAPRPQSREKLANLLWGSHFETQARQNLRQSLVRLRRILGQEAIFSDDHDVWLAPGVIDCDAVRFEALILEGSRASLAAAADLYRNPLLADLNIDEDAWSEWRDRERERLEDLAVDSMVRHGQHALQSGNPEFALKNANRAIAVNGLREDAHRLIIQALTATGRKAEALKRYQHLVVLLKRELNTEPDAVTQSLVAGLRNARPSAAAHVSEPTRGVDEPGPEAVAVTARDGDAPPQLLHRGSRQQRQLTIMACDLMGAMSLSADRDPEDVHDQIIAFHQLAANIAAQFHGFVAQHQGNGVLIYFGYPTANEHDAEHAVRAGLAIVDAVRILSAPAGNPPRASVGIATGLVVIGEKPIPGDMRQQLAIGETPDLAMRLRTAAAPGQVVIAAGTRRLLGQLFEYRRLPDIEAKGLPHALTAWDVLGEAVGVSRFDARRAGSLSVLVGREEEIELLLRRWDQARSGAGRVVVLSGEPGIGKSRLVESVLERLEDGQHRRLRYFCSPHHTHSALYPVIAQLEQAANFESGSGAGARIDRLEALLEPTATNLPLDVALIAELVGVPMDGRYPALAISPQQRREMTLNALLNQLSGGTGQTPVLIVVEDAHWIDPTSLDLLDAIVARASNLPLLLLVTARPGFQPSWVGQPHVAMLPLNRLGRSESAGIIGDIARDDLPDAIVEQILSRTDGVPLFIEELTHALLEDGLSREASGGSVIDGALPSPAIPTTLKASLAARLDLLGDAAKDVASIGAAIGREFSYELIAAISALAPLDIDAALGQLTASGLVTRRGMPPLASYSFKHALVQDSAYVTMLRSQRQQLHADIARALIKRSPAQTESHPEIVAHHFTEAGLAREAVDHWIKAGRLAHARWANREAANFFERALRGLETLPETTATMEQAIDLRFDLKTSLDPLGQFGRILSYLREAEVLARRLDDPRRLCQVSIHLCQTLGMSGNPKDAVEFGRKAPLLADSLGDLSLQVAASLFLGTVCFSTQYYGEAESHFLKVLGLLDGDLSFQRFSLAAFPAVSARSYLTRIYADQGKFERGIALGEEGIRLAEAVDHPYSLSIVCWCLADLLATRGEVDRAVVLHERGLKVAREWKLPFLAAGSSGSLGHVYCRLGRTAKGLPMLEQALAVFEKMDHRFAQTLFLAPLGEACMLAGRHADALRFAAKALAMARENGQRSGEAAALHVLGEASGRDGSPEQAEGYYREALALAKELDLRPLAARCHHGLGKLYLHAGRPDQAGEQLAAATTMYLDMDMRFWLEQADAELSRLPHLAQMPED
ncbi:AAA family ATPase [Bradyrhizobium sp. CCBAU 51627]|uniref:AAA family ATPase n=1 Tax=Bradyrhizobium sp. CCBAU 51627 TaxID=1325088 RepID=UPI002306CC66|nr:AAA family ATPase [Bradyrhizobium sp. CCBAU 51627]MDA9436796.1 adenylate cyclase [Bradyrhizobium sp. CCBAU 51627]